MTSARAKEILHSFKGKRILVIGDICIDHYITGVVERLNPEAPVPILRVTGERSVTGAAGNTAKNIAALTAKASLISIAGKDAAADQFEELARVEGYAVQLVRDASRTTIRKVRHLVHSQQLLRVDYEQTHEIADALQEKLLSAVEKAIQDGLDAIIVSDYAKGVITEHVGQRLVALAQQHHFWLAADVKPAQARYFVGASAISPNRKEGYEFLGLDSLTSKLSPKAIAEQLAKKMQSEVYLTLGADGMQVVAKAVNKHVPQEHVVEVFDVSGAGDTAAVMLTLARLAGATPEEAAELANAAGAVVVGKVGSATVEPAEVVAMISHKHQE